MNPLPGEGPAWCAGVGRVMSIPQEGPTGAPTERRHTDNGHVWVNPLVFTFYCRMPLPDTCISEPEIRISQPELRRRTLDARLHPTPYADPPGATRRRGGHTIGTVGGYRPPVRSTWRDIGGRHREPTAASPHGLWQQSLRPACLREERPIQQQQYHSQTLTAHYQERRHHGPTPQPRPHRRLWRTAHPHPRACLTNNDNNILVIRRACLRGGGACLIQGVEVNPCLRARVTFDF